MSEPLEMTIDFGPYLRLLTRKPDPAKVSKMPDAELAKRLKKTRRVVDNTRPYAGTIAMITFCSFPAIGYTAMALGAAGPFFWGLGGAYLLFQAFKPLVKAAVLRAHHDVACYEGETSSRAADRALKAQRAKELQERLEAERANAILRRAQEAFEKALDDGIPLEKKIAVKAPFKLKPATKAAKGCGAE